jgi:hypothetical protein
LHLDVVTDDDIIGHHGVLTKRTAATNDGVAKDVAKVPDLCAFTDRCPVVNNRSWMDVGSH